MKVVVVYESMFGNTAQVGEAIADSLRAHGLEVDSSPIAGIEPAALAGAGMLVIGAPTHAHGMSSKGTRKAAVEDKRYGSTGSEEPTTGMRDWLHTMPPGSGKLAAAFDTRFGKPRWLTGSAAKGIGRRLAHQGYRVVVPPESFFVDGQHQLEPGQLERATAWGAQLAERASTGAVA